MRLKPPATPRLAPKHDPAYAVASADAVLAAELLARGSALIHRFAQPIHVGRMNGREKLLVGDLAIQRVAEIHAASRRGAHFLGFEVERPSAHASGRQCGFTLPLAFGNRGHQAHVLERNGREPGERLELRHGAGVVSAHVRPVRSDGGARLRGSDRNHHEAPHERRPVCLLRNSRIETDVGYGDRLTMHHGPAGDAARSRKAARGPQRRDGILGCIEALVVFPDDDGDAVRLNDGASRVTQHADHGLHRLGARQLLIRVDQTRPLGIA